MLSAPHPRRKSHPKRRHSVGRCFFAGSKGIQGSFCWHLILYILWYYYIKLYYITFALHYITLYYIILYIYVYCFVLFCIILYYFVLIFCVILYYVVLFCITYSLIVMCIYIYTHIYIYMSCLGNRICVHVTGLPDSQTMQHPDVSGCPSLDDWNYSSWTLVISLFAFLLRSGLLLIGSFNPKFPWLNSGEADQISQGAWWTA